MTEERLLGCWQLGQSWRELIDHAAIVEPLVPAAWMMVGYCMGHTRVRLHELCDHLIIGAGEGQRIFEDLAKRGILVPSK